jgi:MoaA/NifB/PqqE/SkfB family radical SAM enzyme
MCYVHLSDGEMNKLGSERTAAEWIDMGKQLVEAGTLEVLLTGGEVFFRKDFREIYEAFSEMGLMLHIYTNGFLIDDKVIEWLSKKPPIRIRITMYGASNETYEKVTGIKHAFDRVKENIDKIIASGMTLSLAATYISENVADEKAIEQFAREKGLSLTVTDSVMLPVRGAQSEAETVRMDKSKILKEKYASDKLLYTFAKVKEPFERCKSRQCGYWITWNGKMTICSFIAEPCTYPFENGFDQAWRELQEKLKAVKRPEKCEGCLYEQYCLACPGILASETGSPEQTNDYICDIARTNYDIHETIRKSKSLEIPKINNN